MRLADGADVVLGAVLARAGEGTIYEVAERSDVVAKIFHPDLKNLAAKQLKVAAMAASPPAGWVQSDGLVVLAWPLQLAHGADGAVGFVMRRIDTTNAVEIHSVSNPSNRKNPLPSAPQWPTHVTWRHLVNIAANLCMAVDTVHRVNAVVGDFQERNILVHDTTRVTLVDCDSMQFTTADGQQFLCAVGRPEFTAPELSRGDLSTTARVTSSDYFALAVHIHLLLMGGNHPFLRGEWTGRGDQPDVVALAQSGQWAGGPGSALHTHPLAPPPAFLPDRIQQLFRRAFTDGARNPDVRPSAGEWFRALNAIDIVTCPRDHQIPSETSDCPWCGIDDERSKRRDKRPTPRGGRTTRSTADGSVQSSPPDSSSAGLPIRRQRALIAAACVGAVLIAVAMIAGALIDGHQASPPDQTASEPTTSITSSETVSATSTPEAPPPPNTPTVPPTVPSSYPPPEAQSFESVFQNAKIGECVNRVLGSDRGDGSSELTSFYLTDCGAGDATDKVTERTDDVAQCHENWARNESLHIVLCLTKR